MSEEISNEHLEPEPQGVWFSQGLSGALDTALQLFDEEREAHYAKWIAQHSDEYRERLKEAESISRAIFGDIEKLGSPTVTPFVEHLAKARQHAGSGDDHAVSSAIFGALQVQIGHKVISACCEADGDRLVHLLLLMKRCEASHKTTRFLRCVSRCYLFGFEAECIAMCRAAIDAQFQAEISNDDCISVLGQRKLTGNQTFDLSDRVAVAVKMGRITEEIRDKATLVRKNGNDVLHMMPSTPRPAFNVISDTLAVIDALEQ
ncbi:MAG TPA: hypothetical protein VM008_14945 [Phycisphaerae bacterium]|nr:hypothetical protein [Phycisphaerae bacterium]